MENILKFTGDFTKLKEMGYEFIKLYARNYKVYNKKMPKSFDIWVWVGNGGYIEINDLYSNTKSFVEALKTIDWETIENRESVFGGNYKRIYIRYSHEHPERGCSINDSSLELDTIMAIPEDVRKGKFNDKYAKLYDEASNKVREYYDSEIVVFEESGKNLITELNKINLVVSV